MAASPYRTAEAFVAGKSDHQGQFRSHGDAVYSYNMLLADKDPDGTVVFRYQPRFLGGPGNSTTTNRHMGALEAVVRRDNVPYRVEPRGR